MHILLYIEGEKMTKFTMWKKWQKNNLTIELHCVCTHVYFVKCNMSKPNYHTKQHSNETRMSKNVSKDIQQMPQAWSTALPRHQKKVK